MGRRLPAADAAWIGFDRPEHLMVVTAVLRCDRPVDVTRLRALVTERLLPEYPRLRARVQTSRWPRRPAWQPDPDFAVERHVTSGTIEGPVQEYVARLMSVPLDPAHPLWALTVVHGLDGAALVARMHHCLADGIALAGVLLRLGDGEVDAPTPVVAPAATAAAAAAAAARPLPATLPATLLTAGRTLGQVMAGRGEAHGRLRGPASAGRRAAWTEPIDLAAIKGRASAAGVSVNDVLLAAVAGGLRRWLIAAGEPPTDLRVMIPVDLRRGSAAPSELGNRFGIAFVALPVSVEGAAQRLERVREATTEAKRSAVAPASFLLLRLVGLLPTWGHGLAATVLSRVATVIVTNVPGPREPLTVADSGLSSIVFWVPHVGSIGVGFSIFGYAGSVVIGVAINESLGIDPTSLVAAVESELQSTTTG